MTQQKLLAAMACYQSICIEVAGYRPDAVLAIGKNTPLVATSTALQEVGK